ncbi:phosphate ABC transporter permease subunit PstC [Hydromonas duriensis]|uniref:Phosphate transport system permease protein n=1 Tax=Hydromonas duriensis TaxID=1527608 RepID=A0A4R6Y8C7_9BURK|nr:phosphate ABC transporter permease subunit PstC [Hydromonas duriensis]TDR31646.1 phosphate ABC transporter membrane protein 1 (PhoT family) [Hydromonas duriensis]
MSFNSTQTVKKNGFDAVFKNLTLLNAWLVLLIVIAIIGSLVYSASDTFTKQGVQFLWRNVWDVGANEYGALGPIVGTLLTAGIAIVLALPVSFGIAIFLTELSPAWLRRPLATAIELLAAIPSIIYGMWGLFVLAPLFAQYVQPFLIATLGQLPLIGPFFAAPVLGVGVFTAGVVLSIMIVPFISSVLRDVFELVPPMLKESAYGLGSTTWEVVRYVVIPYTRIGAVGGTILGLGRALGETMAVTFVIGNAHDLNQSLFAPGNSIASTIANEFAEASDAHLSALLSLALVLFLITTVVLSLAKLLLLRLEAK